MEKVKSLQLLSPNFQKVLKYILYIVRLYTYIPLKTSEIPGLPAKLSH